MPYRKRTRSESDIYHVISRGTGKQIIFEDDDDRVTFLELLSRQRAKCELTTYAWCLMDNHVHLLVYADPVKLATAMRSMLGAYARYFNARHGRSGHLFQGRYKSEPVEDDAYFLQIIRYIHQNPEKAGIAATTEYRWSSYGEYMHNRGARARIANTDMALNMFGSIDEFAHFHSSDGRGEYLEPEESRGEAAMRRAQRIAAREIGTRKIGQVKGLPRAERDEAIARLRSCGLSIRQIERLTGVSRSTVATIPFQHLVD